MQYPPHKNSMADIEDESLFTLSEEDLARLKADRDKIDFARTVTVSEETRRECEAELAAAKKRGYRI
jgi:hypothetical protein